MWYAGLSSIFSSAASSRNSIPHGECLLLRDHKGTGSRDRLDFGDIQYCIDLDLNKGPGRFLIFQVLFDEIVFKYFLR